MPDPLETAKLLFARRKGLLGLGKYTEEETVLRLIDPVLAYLEYPVDNQRRELQSDGNRPDIIIYPMSASKASNKPADIILEAKPLKADLDGVGLPRSKRPKNQLRRYMLGLDASQPGTFGVLTDGNIWYVVIRTSPDAQPKFVKEWRLLDSNIEDCSTWIKEIKDTLSSPTSALVGVTKQRSRYPRARSICDAIVNGKTPLDVLEMFLGETDPRFDLSKSVQLSGIAAHMATDYWDKYAFAEGGRVNVEQKDIAHEAVCVAVVRAANPKLTDDATLYREDVAIAAKAFAQYVPVKMSVLMMIQPDKSGEPSAVRLAVHSQGHTGMTTEFDPHSPSPRALRAIERICGYLTNKKGVKASTLTDTVAAKGVRREFYAKVANGWMLRQYRKAKGSAARRHAYRETVLRHLIRTVFAWILKEDGNLSPQAFDEAFAKREAPGTYHANILENIFHERLNKPKNARKAHPNPNIEQALKDIRFLNGSLFARHKNDHLLNLTDEDYFSTDADTPGLFTIFSEYDWTASEHTPQSSEQTIDPEVISNLFENLVAITQYGEEVPDRMPAGTYYTPADVALEMVKDALAEAVIDSAPTNWTRADLRELFGTEDLPLPESSLLEISALRQRIQSLTIYDPAVGSGGFPLISTIAIRTGLQKLKSSGDAATITREIISKQIFAQDINPMAVQVARLRLFVAIIANESVERNEWPPLPNLEGRIVCANTLATNANPEWRPDLTGTFADTDSGVKSLLTARASVIHDWLNAHDEQRKAEVRVQDEEARTALWEAIRYRTLFNHIKSFAKMALLETATQAVHADPRLLFYSPEWEGFDIVIGNPPYEKFSKQDRGVTKAELEAQGYSTLKGNDLYNLFCEVSLSLVKQKGGVVTLVVPLSLSFGQDQKDTRKLFEQRSSRIYIRHQDVRPDKTFHDSPVENQESRQRTTIITAVTDKSVRPVIHTTGTNKWRKVEREQYLLSRSYVPIQSTKRHVDLLSQWARVPSVEVGQMVNAMNTQKKTLKDLMPNGEYSYSLSAPNSPYEYITVVPSGALDREGILLPIEDEGNLELAMALLNGHGAFGWWGIFGDAYHLKPQELLTVAIPDNWLEDADTHHKVQALGRTLIDTIKPEHIRKIITGVNRKRQDSLSFHECAPDTIAEIDKLYLEGLELNQEPLLSQLRTLRSSSTWSLR